MWGTILVIPTIRTVVFWGLCWGPPILGNYHLCIPTCMHLSTVYTFFTQSNEHSFPDQDSTESPNLHGQFESPKWMLNNTLY